MPHLRDVLREARENAGVSHAAIAVQINRVENVVRRFEKGASAPAFAEIDSFVEAYGYVTGIDPMLLWSEALKRRMEEAELSQGAQGEDDDALLERLVDEVVQPDEQAGGEEGRGQR